MSTALLRRAHGPSPRFYVRQLALVVVMLALTAVLQTNILPRMEHDRDAAHGDISSLLPSDPARLDFDRLHILSERLEGAVLLAGVAVVLSMAAEATPLRS